MATYKGPENTLGWGSKAGFSLGVTLFEGTIAKYLPLKIDTGLSFDLFSKNTVLYQTVKPTGSVTCQPDCDVLPIDGSGTITLKATANTTDTGNVSFWISKNDEPQLTQLAKGAFAEGVTEVDFKDKLEPGTYKVYPRMELNGKFSWYTESLPLAAADGNSIGEFTVVGELSLSPPSVYLSGIVGKSDTQDSALQVKNESQAQTDYVLEWSSQTQNVTLSPMSGVLQPQGVDSIAANFSCPAESGWWEGEVEVRRPGGDIEGTSHVSLSCSCEKDCCGHCCQPGEEPPPCGCPAPGRLPPACCPGDTSGSCSNQGGDPHLTTFDRLGYDFQGVGEFILAKSLVLNDTFEAQGRYVPWHGRTDVSVAQAVAVRVGQNRVAYYKGMYPPLRINGVPTELANGETISLSSGGTVTRGGSTYRVSATDGSLVDVRGTSNMFIGIRVPASKYGKVQGLFGNADQNRENDVAMPDGTVLGTNLAFETLYPKYADSWRITQKESLFDYEPGETTETFTDRNFPRMRATVEDLPANIRTIAETTCRAAGITDQVLLDNCILDVALTGDSSFADIPADAINPTGTVAVALPPPTINDSGFGQFKGVVQKAVTAQQLNSGQVSLTMDGNPLPGNNTHSITNGVYQTAIVPTGGGYRLDIDVDGYIPERVYGLSAPDRQLHEVDPVQLVPMANGEQGAITGRIRNALNNSNVPNLNITARRYVNKRWGLSARTVTDQNGGFTLDGLDAGNYTLEIQGTGYVTTYLNAVNIGGQADQIEGIISPELGESQFRIVLSWENPLDFDPHLTGPDGQGDRFHIYYENRGSDDLRRAPHAYLDRDDTDGFGPETIKIGRLLPGDTYRYSVFDFLKGGNTSSQALGQSGARVKIYGDGNRLIETFHVPQQAGTLWTVFEITEFGVVVPVNDMSYASVRPDQRKVRSRGEKPPVRDYWQMLFQPRKK
jgi:hypothetical protein